MIRMMMKFAPMPVAAVLLMAAQPSAAGSVPFLPSDIAIAARDQQISAFLGDFFGKTNMRVKVSPLVVGKINGNWRGPPAVIWRQLASAFNLVAHYDGAVVRIYAASEVTSRTVPSIAPADLVRQVTKMNLVDANNIIKAGSASVVATGVPYFVDQVTQLAPNARVAAVTAPPVITPTPLATMANPVSGIVSPRTTMPAVYNRPTFQRSNLVQSATARSPYEVRIFYLRYAKADDTIIGADGAQSIRRGVASILRGMMGDGRKSETVTSSHNGNASQLYRSSGQGSRELSSVNDDRFAGESSDQGARVGDVNGPRIEVDAANNAVLVRDRPEAMGTHEGIIAGLDIEPRIIEIEATIIELDVTRLKNLGVDISFNTNRLGALFGGQPIQGNTAGSDLSGSFLTGAGGLFQARINALEQNGSLRITQRPRIIAINNQESIFDNQTRFNTRVAGERDARLFEIRYGIVLRVTPTVIDDGNELRTRLSVVVQDGKFAGFNVDGIPARNDSNLSTETIIKQGESLLIGGMTIDAQIDSRSKVPILGDVPIVGNVFKKRRSTTQNLERLILITPRIVSLSDEPAGKAQSAQPVTPIPIEQLKGKGKRPKQSRSSASRSAAAL